MQDNSGRDEGRGAGNGMVTAIVAAFAQREDVGVDEIVELTRRLTGLAETAGPEVAGRPAAGPSAGEPAVTPAVPVEDAVQRDHVVCLCCGRAFKTLKRHLRAAHGLSETEYRARFGLSPDVPIVAPSYSERRSAVALEAGFGTHDRDRPDQPAWGLATGPA